MMALGVLPSMRLTASALLPGWMKFTDWPAPTLKLCQLNCSVWLPLLDRGSRTRLADRANARHDLTAAGSARAVRRDDQQQWHAGEDNCHSASRTFPDPASAAPRTPARKLRRNDPLSERSIPAQAVDVVHGSAYHRQDNEQH